MGVLSGLLIEPEVSPVQEQDEPGQLTPTWCSVIGAWRVVSWRRCGPLQVVRRFLVSRQRDKRLSQETEVQHWLLQQLVRPQKEAAAA